MSAMAYQGLGFQEGAGLVSWGLTKGGSESTRALLAQLEREWLLRCQASTGCGLWRKLRLRVPPRHSQSSGTLSSYCLPGPGGGSVGRNRLSWKGGRPMNSEFQAPVLTTLPCSIPRRPLTAKGPSLAREPKERSGSSHNLSIKV